MKDTIQVTFKRCKEGQIVPKGSIMIYRYSTGEITAAAVVLNDQKAEDLDLWYTEASNFKEKPKTAEEYVDEYKKGGHLINLEEFAEMILNQERGNDDK